MPATTVINVSDKLYRALQVRATANGHGIEVEVHNILEAAVKPEHRVKLGSMLAEIGSELGGVDLQIVRDKTPPRALIFDLQP